MKYNFILLSTLLVVVTGCGNSETTSNVASPHQGLVAYYPLNGNANDMSGNGNNGIVHGATLTTNRNGTENSAYYFNGSSYIEVPNSSSLSSATTGLTIATWIYVDSYVDGCVSICAKSDSSNDGQYRFQIYDTGIWAWKGFGIANVTYLPIQQWHFVAFTWNGYFLTFYLDGTPVATSIYSGTLPSDNYPLEIGMDTPGATEFFIGKLSDLRIYNRALSDTEILDIFEQ